MFILDSLMISGIRWALQTVATAADAEMNDDAALREQLLEAEMRREMGELSDEEFRRTEASLLARIREIRERRGGGSGPLGFTTPDEEKTGQITVEASLTGDFHPPSPSPSASARQVPNSGSADTRGVVEASVSSASRRAITATPKRSAKSPATSAAEAVRPRSRNRLAEAAQPRRRKRRP